MVEINVVKDDVGYDINFTLQNSDSTVLSLVTATALLFRVQDSNIGSLKFSKAMNIVSASAGTCKYTTATGDFDKVGTYNVEIQVSFSGGKIITFDDVFVIVGPKIPYS